MPKPWLPAKQELLVAGMAKGYVLHEGPSPFVGQPIVSIATNEEWICDLLRAMSRKVETGELD